MLLSMAQRNMCHSNRAWMGKGLRLGGKPIPHFVKNKTSSFAMGSASVG